MPAHVTERDAAGEPVARDTVDLDVEIDRAERLRTEGARPPAGRIVDGEHPRQLVGTGRERRRPPRIEDDDVSGTAHDGVQMRLARFAGRVEGDVARDAGAFDRRVDAQHARMVDANRSGRREPDVAPDASGIQRAVEHG